MNKLVQILKSTRQYLITGIPHMIPFVVLGSILLAVSVMLYGEGIVSDAVAGLNLKKLSNTGIAGLTLMVSFLAVYIGCSTAGRPALTPCIIGTWVGNSFGADFFGTLIARIISGIVMHYLEKIPAREILYLAMPIFITSIIGTLVIAGVMIWGLGEPVGTLTDNLTQQLRGMQQGSTVVLTMIVSLMLAFNTGDLANKVAYVFMLIRVTQGIHTMVTIAAVGICVLPLGMELATPIGRRDFPAEGYETGKTVLMMGCVGVIEGTVPFVATNPLRVTPSIMAGSTCGVITVASVGTQCYAGRGGLIVLSMIEDRLGYIAAVTIGAVMTAVCMSVLKSLARKDGSPTEEKEGSLDLDPEIN